MTNSLHSPRRGLLWLAVALIATLPNAGCKTPGERKKEKMEEIAREQAEAHKRAIGEIVDLAQRHTSDTVILNLIHTNHVNYQLTGDDIINLKSQGVDDAVVTAMQATSAQVPPPPPRRIYVDRPPPPVYVEPGPVVVGVGGWHRW